MLVLTFPSATFFGERRLFYIYKKGDDNKKATQAASVSLSMFKHRVKEIATKQHQCHSACLNIGLKK